ncbi:MAG: AraC family transcriptional regulator [Candidatus Symbiothrix sp.]|jgi:AraC-like DNA-binding protein|nr:AraC family transcriptional regulator [Candidatus Symbiothrix sp.]
MKINKEKNLLENLTLESKFQNVWKSFDLPKGYCWEGNTSLETTIFFVTKGSIRFVISGLEACTIYSQEMFIIPVNCKYEVEALEQIHLVSCVFYVESLYSEQILIDELLDISPDNQDKVAKLPVKKTLKSYLTLLEQCIKDGLGSYYFLDLKRHELFLLLFAYYTKQDLARFLYSIISENIQFKGFILNNYQQVKNVKELAGLANYSTSGFIKKFRRYFNESPYKWMQKQKAEQILRDIKHGIKSLQEIATEYNFSSYQHFANFCKTQFGFPPTEIADKYTISNLI